MREIKFRAWDKELKQMIHTKDLEWYDDSFGFRLEKHTEDIEQHLMQFTGVIDRNGKEIYEGDIIEFLFEGVLKTSKVKYELKKGFYLEFESFGHRSKYNISLLTDYDRRTIIVGNIYENPELLG